MTPIDRDDAMDDGAPVHPDIALITDYLAREATQEQIDEVARRLRDDQAFRDNTALVMAA